MEERIINIGTRLKQRRKEMHIRHIFLILKVARPTAV